VPAGYNAYQQYPQGNPDVPPNNYVAPAANESEAPLLTNNDFSDKFGAREDRMNFVRKVYAILGIQLLFTACIVCIPLFNTRALLWMRRTIGLLIAAIVL
jgi:FtsH-binding integral membrane protein